MDQFKLPIPYSDEVLKPGDRVRLGLFEEKEWKVKFGWYSFGGNRPVCGWFLESDNGLSVKPIQLPDLSDIYVVRR